MQRFYKLNTLGSGSSDLCIVDRFIEGINPKSHLVVMGERVGALYPRDAVIRMNPDRKGIRLAPLLGNTEGMIMVSKDLVEIIRKHTTGVDIEYLPFTLLDPRGRVHSSDYCIVNPLVWVDALDHAKSGTELSKSSPDVITYVERWTIDKRKVADAPQLFRVRGINGTYVIGYDIAAELHGKFENVYWEKLPFSDEV